MKHSKTGSQQLPEEFLNKMAFLLGDEFYEFFSSLNQPPWIGIRVNTLKISPQAFSQISPYKISPLPWCSSGYAIDANSVVSEQIPPGKHLHHITGLYYLQEPSAMAAAEALSPQPGDKILDLAAAPGGKATHLAALMKNKGLLVANEIHPKRVWDLAENLERCGVTNAIVTNESPQMLSTYFTDYFDRVMLDAPCSGEGMFRKSETARKEWKLDSPRSCAIRQYRLLEYASQMVKTGGCIAYTTCTFSPEENEGVIAKFLENHTEFGIKNIEQLGGLSSAKPEWIGLPTDHMVSQTMRIWPHLSSGEGHFIALLIKHKSSKNDSSEYKNKYKISSRRIIKIRETSMARTLLSNFSKAYLNVSFDEKRIHLKGTYVYYLPEMAPNMSGIKVIHPGWWIGSIQKGRFTPSHALAMGIKADQAKHTLSFLSGDQVVSAYIRGNSFSNQGENSWVLVTVDGYPIGWGKRVQNVIKNYYPHGLRQQS